VAAQVNFDRRGEPTQRHRVDARNHKGGLGQIVLGGDRSQHAIFQPLFENDHGRGVAGEQSAGESVDLEKWYFHRFFQAAGKCSVVKPV
jgi:hypothetical protein